MKISYVALIGATGFSSKENRSGTLVILIKLSKNLIQMQVLKEQFEFEDELCEANRIVRTVL